MTYDIRAKRDPRNSLRQQDAVNVQQSKGDYNKKPTKSQLRDVITTRATGSPSASRVNKPRIKF